MENRAQRPFVLIALAFVCMTALACDRLNRNNAVRVDAISGILDAFKAHQIVALGEGLHGNEQAHAFRLALLRDPRFPTVVNDIVVEFGSGRYQAVMDRFISGEEVPYSELRKAWQDTTAPNTLWDTPIYEEFFRAVREVNAPLPSDRRIRVLLGDAPIAWEAVKTADDLTHWISQRDAYAAKAIESDILARNRRALLIYADLHFTRDFKIRGASAGNPNVGTLLQRNGTKVFTVWTNTTVELNRLQPNIASWPIPSLTIVRGTRLGTLDFKYFSGLEGDPPVKMQDQFDGILYLGPPSSITFARLPRSLCADGDYVKMRLARMSFQPSSTDADEFKQACGS